MAEREQIKERIREVLASQTQAINFSNRLFSPDGLFKQLARTEAERRQIAQSRLFKVALSRLNELQRKEAAEFAHAVQQVQTTLPQGDYLVKLEQAGKVGG